LATDKVAKLFAVAVYGFDILDAKMPMGLSP
jgi:hypothetical protein